MGGNALRKCEICGVRIGRKCTSGTGIFLARFPLEPNRCRLWVKATGNEDLAYLPLFKLNENKFICGDHFSHNMFNKNRSRLKKNALPTLNLFEPPLSDDILADFPIHDSYQEKKAGILLNCPASNSKAKAHSYMPQVEEPAHNFHKRKIDVSLDCPPSISKSRTSDVNVEVRPPTFKKHKIDGAVSTSIHSLSNTQSSQDSQQANTGISLDHSYCDLRTETSINHAKEEVEISETLQETLEEDPLAFEDDKEFPKQFEKLALDEVAAIPPDIVAWPEPSKNETEVNKSEDPFLPEDSFLPDSQDPEVIMDGVQPDLRTYGDETHPKLCVLWPPILTHGLTTEARNTILNGYLIPKNCRLFQAPKMNAKIVEMVPEKAMANDSKWAAMQQYIGTALTAINRAMETLLSGAPNSKVLALRHLSNACLLLSDLHCSHTKIRVKNVTPYLDDTTQEVIKGLERDETVFGNNFIKKWKMAKKREKPVKKVRPPKKERKKKVAPSGRSLVLYSGRWHPPLRKTGKVRGKKVGAGVRRQNVSNSTPRVRQVQQSKVRAPDHSGQHILTSTESGSAQNNLDEGLTSFLLKRPSSPKTYSTKKRKREAKIAALAPDIETSHIHKMPMEESDSFVQNQSTEEQLNQSRITPNSTIMVTTGAVPLVLPPRDMPTLLTYYDENVPPDPSTYIEIADDQTLQGFVDTVTDTDCQESLSLFLRFKDT